MHLIFWACWIISTYFPILCFSEQFSGQDYHKGTPAPFPVIGILSQPSQLIKRGYPPEEFSTVIASYVKHLESAGAEVIVIQWDIPFDDLDTILEKVNGVLFAGGSTPLSNQTTHEPSLYGKAGQYIVNKAIEFNRRGDYFPIWGICLGFELLTLSVANDFSLLTTVADGKNISKPIHVTLEGIKNIYSHMNPDLLRDITTKNLSFFNHKYSLRPDAFVTNANLASNFSVAAWANDSKIGSYAAVVVGKQYPLMGSILHPEKNTFEWYSKETVPRGLQAVRVQQFYAFHFVNHTMLSKHRFDSMDDFKNFWIARFQPAHFKADPEFEQYYIFKNYKKYNPEDKLFARHNKHEEQEPEVFSENTGKARKRRHEQYHLGGYF